MGCPTTKLPKVPCQVLKKRFTAYNATQCSSASTRISISNACHKCVYVCSVVYEGISNNSLKHFYITPKTLIGMTDPSQTENLSK